MKKPTKPIVMVDDESSWLLTMARVLQVEAGFNNTLTCRDPHALLPLLRKTACSVVMLDLNMPEKPGLELLDEILEEFPTIKVLIVSGMNQIETAVECVRRGAFNYIVKSSELSQLIISLHNALLAQELAEENRTIRKAFLAESVSRPECFAHMVTCSPKMQTIFRYCESLIYSPEPVLITGESGVGKELITKALHQLFCPDEQMVSFNVAGLDDSAFSDTLFGHVKGAYTGAAEMRRGLIDKAGRGIVFFDEIGDIDAGAQLKLLRLLQEREYYPLGSDSVRKSEARFIFASNRDLEKEVEDGRFRKDLFYRLNSHHIVVPPLRERPQDIPLLLTHYCSEATEQMQKGALEFSPVALRQLTTYPFPGNIRELRTLVYDLVARSEGQEIDASSVLCRLPEFAQAHPFTPGGGEAGTLVFGDQLPSLKDANQQLIDEALARTDGNHRKAAEMLGMTRSALSKRLAKN